MNRRLGAVAIVLMALTALAGVLSYVFLSKKDPQISVAQKQAVEDPVSPSPSPSLSPSTSSASSTPASSGALRPDQPVEFKPTAFVRDPSWRLLDWSVKPFPGKPGVEMRASSWAASGKHSFIRVEEQIQRDTSGKIQVLHIKEMVGDQIIVKLPEGATQENAETMAAKIGARAGSRPFAPDTWLFKLDQKLEAVPEGMENLKSSGAVIDYTEPDLIVRPARLPNDPKVTDFTAWHLYNNIQIDKDIKAAKAWDRRTSAAYGTTNKVIVAVLDSGVRYSHQDLSANMWRNPGETPGDGIDNDNNGWVDDVFGIDAFGSEDFTDSNFNAKREGSYTDSNNNRVWDSDSDPMDTDGHGTHCAGLIGAVGNNGIGSAGVAWAGVEIMALRFIGPVTNSVTGQVTSSGSLSDEVLCMDYARLRGAKVINASFGQDGGQSQTEIDAINRLNTSGVILVAAAGNGSTDNVGDNNNGLAPFYPASYTNSNIIAVGATDRNDNKTGFSNFGATAVDLFAPGDNMYSTRTGSDTSYGSGSGTSFAAPVVSGALALLIAEYPDDTVSQRVNRVVSTNAVDVIPALSGLCVTGGRLNLAKLLPAADVNTLSPALVWHRPDHLEGLIPSAMRTPSTITLSNTVTIYSGLKKFNNTNGVNTNGLVNQTGGWLFFRTSSAVAWTSNALAWHTNNGDYQFWKATIPAVPARTFQYYLQLDFDSGARTTYSYYTNNADGFTTTTNQATAQSSPYTFTVPKATATVTISSTNQTYNGSARPVSISTTPSGLSNSVTYNGNSSAPTNAGTYNVVATVTDSNYEGSATSTLTITKASATISLGNLIQTYDGTSRTVTATTSPTNLPVTITYNGASSAPTNAGTYTVVATVNEPNYEGSATDTLTVAQATQTITFSTPSTARVGEIRGLSASTASGLPVTFASSDNSIASVAGSEVTFQASGDVTLTASQAGNDNYLAASNVAAMVSVSGVQNPTGDTNGDGIPNLLEYALATNSNGSILPVLDPPTNGTLTLTAIVRTNDPGLTNVVAQGVTNLLDYTNSNSISTIPGIASTNPAPVPPGFQRRAYEFNAGTNASRAFLKLTIQQQ